MEKGSPRFFLSLARTLSPKTQDYNHYNNNLKNSNNNNNATIVRPLLRLVTITTTATILPSVLSIVSRSKSELLI